MTTPRWQRVLDYIHEHPGLTGTEIWQAIMPEYSRSQFKSTIGYLRRQHLVENRASTSPSNTPALWYAKDLPTKVEKADIPYFDTAQEILSELLKMPKGLRVEYLARRLQEIAS